MGLQGYKVYVLTTFQHIPFVLYNLEHLTSWEGLCCHFFVLVYITTCSFFRIYIIKVVHQQVLVYCSYLVKDNVCKLLFY
nr:MAG TPA: hypothetical protein [Bacteriophage sp.]